MCSDGTLVDGDIGSIPMRDLNVLTVNKVRIRLQLEREIKQSSSQRILKGVDWDTLFSFP